MRNKRETVKHDGQTFTVHDVMSIIPKCTVVGKKTRIWRGVNSLVTASEKDLTFITSKADANLLEDTRASIILAPRDRFGHIPENKTVILCDNPRLAFLRVAKRFIGADLQEGIHPTVVIYHPYVKIGVNVTIRAYAVLGGHGFGYERNEKGELEKFPHYGNAVVEDNVDIGSFSTVERAAFGSTVVGHGSKIDSFVHVGHNVRIGENCVVAAGAILAGSVTLGKSVFVGVNSCIKQSVHVGDGATVGMGSVVIHDVAKNDVVAGSPAVSISTSVQKQRQKPGRHQRKNH
jgi:UDP-3-O-[3-hydroxymyristoyl] glucosamine N-acyltransferase